MIHLRISSESLSPDEAGLNAAMAANPSMNVAVATCWPAPQRFLPLEHWRCFRSLQAAAGMAATAATDAELVRMCAEFIALDRRYEALCNGASTPEEDRAADSLLDRTGLLGDRICDIARQRKLEEAAFQAANRSGLCPYKPDERTKLDALSEERRVAANVLIRAMFPYLTIGEAGSMPGSDRPAF